MSVNEQRTLSVSALYSGRFDTTAATILQFHERQSVFSDTYLVVYSSELHIFVRHSASVIFCIILHIIKDTQS
jgi:hypothetical protein